MPYYDLHRRKPLKIMLLLQQQQNLEEQMSDGYMTSYTVDVWATRHFTSLFCSYRDSLDTLCCSIFSLSYYHCTVYQPYVKGG